jgi:V8-like Glu-specific endopeptidase
MPIKAKLIRFLAISLYSQIGFATDVQLIKRSGQPLLGPPHSVVIGEENRLPSFEPRIGRLREKRHGVLFCSAALISKSCALTAGHCSFISYVMEFDIPDGKGKFTYGSPENTFEIDRKLSTFESNGKNSDWAVIKLKPNSITKKLPGEERGFFEISKDDFHPLDQIAVIGYGAAENAFSFLQQRGDGIINQLSGDTSHHSLFLEHTADTGNSSSGSPVLDLNSFELIGIHTFGDKERLVNSATVIMGHQKLQDLIKKCVTEQ